MTVKKNIVVTKMLTKMMCISIYKFTQFQDMQTVVGGQFISSRAYMVVHKYNNPI